MSHFRISFLVVLALAAAPSLFATQRPKLVVFIAIDQLRSDYLPRFKEHLLPATQKDGSPGGFRYFMEKGAYFPAAETGHGTNVTAPGHATMSTGALPYTHGIVSNKWYDAESKHPVYALEDRESPVLTQPNAAKEKGRSPKNLLSTTLSDEIKTAFGGKPIVVTVALKDRAAILLGGHRADLALWFDDSTKGLTTSLYYAKTFPEWLNKWNETRWPERKVPLAWNRILPEDSYAFSTASDGKPYQNYRKLGTVFPHPIDKSSSAFIGTPWGSAYVLDSALEAVKQMGMGKDKITDFLGVGLSSFDIAGHAYGVNSEQMQDFFIRQDRLLANFLGTLKKNLPDGLSEVLFVLTADHGVTEIPSIAQSARMPFDSVVPEKLTDAIHGFFEKEFGLNAKLSPIASVSENNLYLNKSLFKEKKIDLEAASKRLARWLATQPCIALAYTKWELLTGAFPALHFAKRLATSTHASRSGDVVYSPTGMCPQYEHYGSDGAEHGHVFTHDASLPIMLVGKSFKPGTYYRKATLADIAPTVAAAIGVIPPTGAEGELLSEAIR